MSLSGNKIQNDPIRTEEECHFKEIWNSWNFRFNFVAGALLPRFSGKKNKKQNGPTRTEEGIAIFSKS